ncbi:MAG: TIGR00341 family protein [Candidatus Hodarchaeales archaeon]
MKQVQIVVPYDKTESVFDFLHNILDVKNIIKLDIENGHLYQFRIQDDGVLEAIEGLKSRGVGVEFGFIDILDLKASLPRESSEESKENRMQREATLAVEEIYDSVKKQTELSFDFIAFIILSAIMAGIGLVQNNVVIIVASMLLSPLMGPMLGIALGYVIRDWDLSARGTYNETIALLLSFAVGAILGILMPLLDPNLLLQVQTDWGDGTNVFLTEITRRGILFSPLDVGIAIFSGAAVAVSVTKGDMSSLVGVAISAALMPPAVNVGMMITMGIVGGSPIAVLIGVNSFLLLTMNIILIAIAAYVMFKIKKVTVIADKSAEWKAVTKFKSSGKIDLYHSQTTDEASTGTTPAATFTPAETPTEAKTETQDAEKESNDDSNG